MIELEEDNVAEHDVVFNEIKETIIQGIRNAKYTIWAAVAWFTDKDIFEELLAKKKQGVSIRIITSDEKIYCILSLCSIKSKFKGILKQWGGLKPC